MCLLTFYPEGSLVDAEALDFGAQINADGHGYGIIIADRIVTRKSMNAELLIEEFERLRKKHPEGPALFHSRIATAGSVTEYNCHPFFVGGDKSTIVAHNGVLPQESQPGKGDKRSDTRIFAERLLPMRNIRNARGRRKLETWLGYDKVAILTTSDRYDKSSYILNERYGQWDDGVWYSNDSYARPRWRGFYIATAGGFRGDRFGDSTYYRSSWEEGAGPSWYRERQPDSMYCYSKTFGNHIHFMRNLQVDCSDGRCTIVMTEETFVEEWAADWGLKPTERNAMTSYEYPFPEGTSTRLAIECNACGTMGKVSSVTLTCTICLTCQECGGVTDEKLIGGKDYPCQCHVPPRLSEDVPAVLDGMDGDACMAGYPATEEEWDELTSAEIDRLIERAMRDAAVGQEPVEGEIVEEVTEPDNQP